MADAALRPEKGLCKQGVTGTLCWITLRRPLFAEAPRRPSKLAVQAHGPAHGSRSKAVDIRFAHVGRSISLDSCL